MLASRSLRVNNVCLLFDKMKHFLKLKTCHKLALLQILKESCITITVTKKKMQKDDNILYKFWLSFIRASSDIGQILSQLKVFGW